MTNLNAHTRIETETSELMEVKSMGNLDMHIGEMLARNARMYPDEIALIEKGPAEKKRLRDYVEGV